MRSCVCRIVGKYSCNGIAIVKEKRIKPSRGEKNAPVEQPSEKGVQMEQVKEKVKPSKGMFTWNKMKS